MISYITITCLPPTLKNADPLHKKDKVTAPAPMMHFNVVKVVNINPSNENVRKIH